MAASHTLSDSLTWSRYRSKKGQNRGQAVLLFVMIKPNLYEPSGYLDMPSIINSGFPFIFLPAARGTGKTFGTLRYFTIQEEKIMLLRRTQKEANLQAHSDSSSYKDVMQDVGHDFKCYMSDGVGRVIDQTAGFTAAVCAALSTFASVRGMGYSDIKTIVYDEFIAEPHVKKLKNEGMALANLYESVDRNRQLNGADPVQLLCLANSVNMNNDIFMYFDLITHAEEMISNMEEMRIIGNKLLIIPQHSPISDRKAQTALYQAVNDEFTQIAIKNKFILNDFSYVQPRNLQEYRCMYKVGDLYVFKHKTRHEFYVTYQKGKTKNIYGSGYAALAKFRRDKWRMVPHYYDGMIRFESYQCVALFEKYFDI